MAHRWLFRSALLASVAVGGGSEIAGCESFSGTATADAAAVVDASSADGGSSDGQAGDVDAASPFRCESLRDAASACVDFEPDGSQFGFFNEAPGGGTATLVVEPPGARSLLAGTLTAMTGEAGPPVSYWFRAPVLRTQRVTFDVKPIAVGAGGGTIVFNLQAVGPSASFSLLLSEPSRGNVVVRAAATMVLEGGLILMPSQDVGQINAGFGSLMVDLGSLDRGNTLSLEVNGARDGFPLPPEIATTFRTAQLEARIGVSTPFATTKVAVDNCVLGP